LTARNTVKRTLAATRLSITDYGTAGYSQLNAEPRRLLVDDSRAAVDPPRLVCVLAIRRRRDILSFVPPLVENSQLSRVVALRTIRVW